MGWKEELEDQAQAEWLEKCGLKDDEEYEFLNCSCGAALTLIWSPSEAGEDDAYCPRCSSLLETPLGVTRLRIFATGADHDG